MQSVRLLEGLLMLGLIAAVLFAESAVTFPEVSAAAFFHSRKVERGLIENRDPVFGLEAEIEWIGFRGGFESCHDMTDANGRRGRYNELTARAGYSREILTWLEASADYIHRQTAEDHTGEIEAETRFPLAWCVPHVMANIDTKGAPGAFYGVLGASKDICLAGSLILTPEIGMGFGNRRRNRIDFDCGRNAARDVHVGISAAWKFSPGFELCPYVTIYDQFTKDGRRTHDVGFFAVAGCAIRATF